MRPCNLVELEHLSQFTENLIGRAEFQVALGNTEILTLKFWNEGVIYLTFNLTENKPFFAVYKDKTLVDQKMLKKAFKKPITIFMEHHFKNKKLENIRLLEDYGRVVRFKFDDDELYLEFRAYPGGLNLGAVSGSKKVFVTKPQELIKANDEYTPETVRSPEVLIDQGLDFLNRRSKNVSNVQM